ASELWSPLQLASPGDVGLTWEPPWQSPGSRCLSSPNAGISPSRFQGQETWFCVDQRGKYSSDFLQLRDVPVVAIDLTGSVLNYDGLDNLVKLTALKSLDLSRCPHVDDWTLNRLHVFKDSLEELSLAGCPQVTERGLACLHQLE
uniref:Distal membrane arm assembly component 2 n=1 Tax=Gopherus evgoodei TaxID=1825980 RepID=A0A8C4Y6D5_9SAUR